MGLWLEQECARAWDLPFAELHRLAEAAPADVPLFDPDDDAFLAPGDMPARIAAACARSGQREPRDRGETARAILVSLACKYRFVLERLEAVTGRDDHAASTRSAAASRNELLCRLTADLTGREVRRRRRRGDRARQRARAGARRRRARLARRHARGRRRLDRGRSATSPPPTATAAEATYRRFLDVTGLATPTAV